METTKVRIRLAAALAFLGAVTSAAATAAGSLDSSWQDRSAGAHEALRKPGLDACDKAYESAFANPNKTTVGKHPAYKLRFTVDQQRMTAMYEFDGRSLNSFVIINLPRGWLAYQKAHSKTLSVLVPTKRCAFDICTSDPFVDGPCSGE